MLCVWESVTRTVNGAFVNAKAPEFVTEMDSVSVSPFVTTAAPLIVPVATLLRKALLELAIARQSSEGRETKAGLIYQYLIGPRFRQRVQAIVEAFTAMQEDLSAEKKASIVRRR